MSHLGPDTGQLDHFGNIRRNIGIILVDQYLRCLLNVLSLGLVERNRTQQLLELVCINVDHRLRCQIAGLQAVHGIVRGLVLGLTG